MQFRFSPSVSHLVPLIQGTEISFQFFRRKTSVKSLPLNVTGLCFFALCMPLIFFALCAKNKYIKNKTWLEGTQLKCLSALCMQIVLSLGLTCVKNVFANSVSCVLFLFLLVLLLTCMREKTEQLYVLMMMTCVQVN